MYSTNYLTMTDGKTFNTLADSSSQSCGICGDTPKAINDLYKIEKLKTNETLYEYGFVLITYLDKMSGGYAINAEAFKSYGLSTAKLYIKLYTWC